MSGELGSSADENRERKRVMREMVKPAVDRMDKPRGRVDQGEI